MKSLSVSLLGSFNVTLSGKVVTRFGSDKVQALLAYLAVESNRPHQRSTLAGLLWPDQPEHAARHNLSQSLLRLRTAIEDRDASTPFLLVDRQTVRFNQLRDHWLDVSLFEACCKTGARAIGEYVAPGQPVAPDVEALRQAAALYHGDFLAHFSISESDLFDEWLHARRVQLRRQALAALETLIGYYEQRAEYEPARYYAGRLIALDEFQESVQRRMMRLLAISGLHSAALAQYERCCRLLADELGVEPEPETIALYEQIRAGAFDTPSRPPTEARLVAPVLPVPLAPASPPAPPPERPKVGPAARDGVSKAIQDWGDAPSAPGLYGRSAELGRLSGWIGAERCRLVAVLGMAGHGKTILVSSLARSLADQFDYVTWRSLYNAPPLAEILDGWLRLFLGSQPYEPRSSLDGKLEVLFACLRRRRCLLVLDSAESIMRAGEPSGSYRASYEDYGQLIRRFAESEHQSCLVLISREQPAEYVRLARPGLAVRSLWLEGLGYEAGQAILAEAGATGAPRDVETLIQRYSGNPLALILIADIIQNLFGGDIASFLRERGAGLTGLYELLDQQFWRLSAREQAVLMRLAAQPEPCATASLLSHMGLRGDAGALLAALRSLQRRALVEQRDRGFALPNLMLTYIAERAAFLRSFNF